MNKIPKKVILTGATGLIGKETIEPFLKNEFEIFALTIDGDYSDRKIHWIDANIFDHARVKEVMMQIQPEYLLHFAWTAQGDYLTSDSNYNWLDSSYIMLKEFINYGGKRAVFAGTCAEYEFQDRPLKESDRLKPSTLYAKCKNELREKAQSVCTQNGVSFGWGRIFYVYGHGENPTRLTPYVVDSLMKNKKVTIKSGPLVKDYMYTKDTASAFVKFLNTNVEGCVNICTANPIRVRDFVLNIATKMQKDHLIEFIDECQNQPTFIVGDNSRLKNEVGYEIMYTLDDAISEILDKVGAKEI